MLIVIIFLAIAVSPAAGRLSSVSISNNIHLKRTAKIIDIDSAISSTTSQRKVQNTDPSIYEDESWVDLPLFVQAAYITLGYDETSWEADGATVWDDYDYWELPSAQKQALDFLGYTEEQWCENDCLCAGEQCSVLEAYTDYDWWELPDEVKQAAIALGYTEEIWCSVNGVNECTLLEADVAPPTVNPTAAPVTPSPTPMPVIPSPTKQPVNVEEELNNLFSGLFGNDSTTTSTTTPDDSTTSTEATIPDLSGFPDLSDFTVPAIEEETTTTVLPDDATTTTTNIVEATSTTTSETDTTTPPTPQASSTTEVTSTTTTSTILMSESTTTEATATTTSTIMTATTSDATTPVTTEATSTTVPDDITTATSITDSASTATSSEAGTTSPIPDLSGFTIPAAVTETTSTIDGGSESMEDAPGYTENCCATLGELCPFMMPNLEDNVNTQNPIDGTDVSVTICCGENDGDVDGSVPLLPLESLIACSGPFVSSPPEPDVTVREETEEPTTSPTESSDAAAGLVSLSMAVTTIVMLLSVSFVIELW